MNDFLKFRKMITPFVVQILFWVGVAFCVLIGFAMIATAGNGYNTFWEILTGLLVIILGPLVVRVYCELIVIFFRMNENLTEIKEKLSVKNEECEECEEQTTLL